MVAGGAALFASLFLTWSHQFPPSLRSVPALSVALRGVPPDATAWQVYSIADVLLATVAAALVAVALAGHRGARIAVALAAAIGLAFALHAMSVPPTNGLDVVNPASPSHSYIGRAYARAGVGETVAVAGLAAGLVGALLGALPRRR